MAASDELYFNRNLIQAVKARPMLYDFRRKDYKDTALKEKIWKSIAEETGRSQQECCSRWRQLRDRYVREKRAERSGVPSGKAKHSWRYMPLMEFLSTYVVHRSSSLENSTLLECLLSSEMDTQISASSEDKSMESPTRMDSATAKNGALADCPASSSSNETPQTSPSPPIAVPEVKHSQLVLKKIPSASTSLPSSSVPQTSTPSQKSPESPTDNENIPVSPKKKRCIEDIVPADSRDSSKTSKLATDHDEMFCLSIVEYFKGIDKMQRLELRARILTTIQSFLSEIKK